MKSIIFTSKFGTDIKKHLEGLLNVEIEMTYNEATHAPDGNGGTMITMPSLAIDMTTTDKSCMTHKAASVNIIDILPNHVGLIYTAWQGWRAMRDRKEKQLLDLVTYYNSLLLKNGSYAEVNVNLEDEPWVEKIAFWFGHIDNTYEIHNDIDLIKDDGLDPIEYKGERHFLIQSTKIFHSSVYDRLEKGEDLPDQEMKHISVDEDTWYKLHLGLFDKGKTLLDHWEELYSDHKLTSEEVSSLYDRNSSIASGFNPSDEI